MIKVVNLKKKYGDFEALKGISFSIERGIIFSFLGPNGAGKTTTLEILVGLRKKTSGEIYFFGQKVDDIDKKIKERIGVLLQKTELFRELTVYETLKLFRSFYKKGYDPKKVLEMIGLVEKKNERVKTLSGGQFQRLSFGLSFINDPEILFLDEPTTGLDPQSRRHIWDIIREFKRGGKTIFLTTHYMEEAQTLSNKVCIIDNGLIIAEGSPDELIKHSGLSTIVEVDGEYNFGKVVEGKTIIETKNMSEVINKLLNDGVEKFIVRHPTLEDVFLKLTGKELRD
ncbi:ABC transporter ATP-binding protein [Thermosipho affectus]|uniref:ABC transporter ATP-binding protein n=1 Tax=Thermosipho affectus TaxID=660294 RepID=A0ABX3IKP8_9BACT|nr:MULTISPECIES: ABC transporter ATP-binding protein [Thermosipho]ANQ53273.1 ABC transporter ATP-binding protein [Thermosipho sp. 1070]ONN27746.1 ABC transporter ATP-binding protein [Thermosipho affectus]OOC45237.1 ABC transporter ATP-binding protein [Thermosipho sp. 1074]